MHGSAVETQPDVYGLDALESKYALYRVLVKAQQCRHSPITE